MRKRNKKSRPARQGGKHTFGRKQFAIERLEQRQLLAGDMFYAFETFALPGPGSLPADTSGFGGDPAVEMAEVASMDDFSNRADGMGDHASAPEAGKNNAAAGQAAHADIQAANLASLLSGETPSSRGLQPTGNGSWDQLHRNPTGVEHRISNPADRYAHLTGPLAGYGTEGSNGYGHGGDDLYAGNGLSIPGFIGAGGTALTSAGQGGSGSGGGPVNPQAESAGGSFQWEPIPGSADAYLRGQLAQGQAWMDAHENGNPADVVSDEPNTSTVPAKKTGIVKPTTVVVGHKDDNGIQFRTIALSKDSFNMGTSTEKTRVLWHEGTQTVSVLTEYLNLETGNTDHRIEIFELGKPVRTGDYNGPYFTKDNVPMGSKHSGPYMNPRIQYDPDAPPPPDMNDDVPPPPEEGNVDPLPGEKTPKIGEVPENPGNPPQDAGVVDPPKDSHQRKHAKSPIPTGPLAENFLDAVDPPNPMGD